MPTDRREECRGCESEFQLAMGLLCEAVRVEGSVEVVR
jgi:hypothetical protein